MARRALRWTPLLALLACPGRERDPSPTPHHAHVEFTAPAAGSTTTAASTPIELRVAPAEGCDGAAPPAATVTWTNRTTGASGPVALGTKTVCNLNMCACLYRWSAEVPLALGVNELQVTDVDADAGETASASLRIGRAPSAPTNLTVTARGDDLVVSWDPSPDATTHRLAWSTSPDLATSTTTVVEDASSPLVFAPPEALTTYHFAVSAVAAGLESARTPAVSGLPRWHAEVVVAHLVPASVPPAFVRVRIAADALGHAHVYVGYTHYTLGPTGWFDVVRGYHYATNASGGWTREDVPSPPYGLSGGAIAVDGSGAANLFVYGSPTILVDPAEPFSGLQRLRREGTGWTAQRIGWMGGGGFDARLDERGLVHVIADDSTAGGLVHVTDASGVFEPDGAGTLPRSVGSIRLGLDTARRPVVLYAPATSGLPLQLATGTGAGWSVEPLSTTASSYALAVAGDAPRLAYVVPGATSVSLASGGTVSDTGLPAGPVALVVDGSGAARVCATASSGPPDLPPRCAFETGAGWRVVTLPRAIPALGWGWDLPLDVARDPGGGLHVVWLSAGGFLVYATDRG